VPAGFRPDPSMPYVSGNAMFCDLNNLVNASTLAMTDYFGLITYTWMVVCAIVPRSTEVWAVFGTLGFKGVLYLIPGTSQGSTISQYATITVGLYDSNPIPSVPICIMSKVGLKPRNGLPNDDLTGITAGSGPVEGYAIQASADTSIDVYVTCEDGPNPNFDMANSTGFLFLYYLLAVMFCLLFLISGYGLVLLQKTKKLCSFAALIMFVEGIICGAWRIFRCVTGPYPYNAPAGYPLDFGAYIQQTSDTPFNVATTFITTMVWVKVVSGKTPTKMQTLLFNGFQWFMFIAIIAFMEVTGLIYPMQPWWGITINNSSGATMDLAYLPGIYANMGFSTVFVITCVFAFNKLIKAAKTGSSALMNTIKSMLPWIIINIIGLIFMILGSLFYHYHINGVDSHLGEDTIWYGVMFKEIGNALSGYGQVMSFFSVIKSEPCLDCSASCSLSSA